VHFCNGTNTKDAISCVSCFLNKNNYLNFAETSPSRTSDQAGSACCVKITVTERASKQLACWRQAVRSLGPLRCSCYQASTRGLATSSSRWDLDWLHPTSGKSHLGGGFALRCFQRLSFLDVAIQLWPRQANWLTSGPAISVLSYWR
jgi:hypothetical protein